MLLSFYSQGWCNGSVHFVGSISLAIRQLACRLFKTTSKFSSSTYFALLVKLLVTFSFLPPCVDLRGVVKKTLYFFSNYDSILVTFTGINGSRSWGVWDF